MHYVSKAALVAWLLGLVMSPALIAQQPDGKVTGTVAYRERMALPAEADINVVLQDVSMADAPAKTVAEVNIPANGRQVPIPFELSYDPAKIDTGHRYSVRATIRSEGMLIFSTTQSYPVITNGAPHRVTLMLQRIGHGAPSAAKHATPSRPAAAPESGTAPSEPQEQAANNSTKPEGHAAESAKQSAEVEPERMPEPTPKAAEPPADQGRAADSAEVPKAAPPEPPPAAEKEKPAPKPAPLPDAPSTSETGKPGSSEAPAAQPELLNTQWKLFELNGKNVFYAPSERPITLAFGPDGERIAGSAGCNAFMGTYINDRDEFRLKPAGTTMMACPDAVMDREQAFLKMLGAVDGYELEGAILTLSSNGKAIARLRNSEDDLANQP